MASEIFGGFRHPVFLQVGGRGARRHAHGRQTARDQSRCDLSGDAHGKEGQKAIADYKIDGKQLYFPNANQPGT
jgi:hypothetical protein